MTARRAYWSRAAGQDGGTETRKKIDLQFRVNIWSHCILSAALSQHDLLEFKIAQLEFHPFYELKKEALSFNVSRCCTSQMEPSSDGARWLLFSGRA